jgi:beta-glucoside PTS system EIICBA component
MGKYKELCEKALEAMGGLENITYVTNCATRLRINYKSKSKVNEEALKNLPGSAGLVPKPQNKQYQIIIGPNVRDAYNDFIDVSGWKETGDAPDHANDSIDDNEEPAKKDLMWALNKFGTFMTPIMMPIVPAMIVGGMILALRNLLQNYCGVSFDGGAYYMVMAIFNAGFNFLPIYVGWQTAGQLRIKPILGAMLGGVLLSSYLPQVTDIFGIPVYAAEYGSTVLPVLLGCIFMAPIYKFFDKHVPESLSFFLVPILTMIIVVPVELVVIGPLGQMLSGAIATFTTWITDKANVIAQPLLAMLYPYMVMTGLEKGLFPIGLNLIATLGYNPVTSVIGFVSNIAVGGSTLAVATQIKDDTAKKGMFASFGVTALCGVTEPAFYGALLTNPIALGGTAIGALAGGLIAGIVKLKTFVMGGCPGWLSLLIFIDTNGDATYMFWAILVGAVTTIVSFVAAKILLVVSARNKAKKVAA